MRFKGQTAIVTGAGQGIGFEICRQLAIEGASVFLNDIDTSLASQAVIRINAETSNACSTVAGDCSDVGFIREMVSNAVKETGKLDLVIANAGISHFGDFFTYTAESF